MTSGTEYAVETSGFITSFGTTRAVDRVDLQVRRGTIVGLLGPYGAGKTTIVRILAALPKPDGGTAHVLVHDIVGRRTMCNPAAFISRS